MKKWLLVLGMITCLAGVTACGNATTEDSSAVSTTVTQDQVEEYVTNTVSSLNQIVTEGQQAQYESSDIIYAALTDWENALAEIGDYRSIESCEFVQDEDGMTITVQLIGSERQAIMTILLDADMNLSSVSTNAQYSMLELMQRAGLNTLMGVGTVFTVLILISLIIYCFNFVPKIQAAFTKKKTAEPVETGVVAQIIENEATASDDFELVAVISAAIAASEGAASSDGYVVRSIRKVR